MTVSNNGAVRKLREEEGRTGAVVFACVPRPDEVVGVDPPALSADSVDKERQVRGVVNEVQCMGGDEGKIRRASQEVSKGCCARGAADIDGSAQSRSRPRRTGLIRRKRVVWSLKMFLISNSTGPPRRLPWQALSRPSGSTTRQQMAGSREGGIDWSLDHRRIVENLFSLV